MQQLVSKCKCLHVKGDAALALRIVTESSVLFNTRKRACYLIHESGTEVGGSVQDVVHCVELDHAVVHGHNLRWRWCVLRGGGSDDGGVIIMMMTTMTNT